MHCYDAACHGALAPNALTLIDAPTRRRRPIPLTGDWATNYMPPPSR